MSRSPNSAAATAAWQVRRQHLLCFHGDNVTTRKWDCGTDVILDGHDLDCLDEEDFGKIWAGRVVEQSDVCDQWKDCGP